MMLMREFPILVLLSLFLSSAFAVDLKPNLHVVLRFDRLTPLGPPVQQVTAPNLNLEALGNANENGGTGLLYFNSVHDAAVRAAQRHLELESSTSSRALPNALRHYPSGSQSPSAQSAVSEEVEIPDDLFGSSSSIGYDLPSASITGDHSFSRGNSLTSDHSFSSVQSSSYHRGNDQEWLSTMPASSKKDFHIKFRYYFFKKMLELGHKQSSTTPFIKNTHSFGRDDIVRGLSEDPLKWSIFWSDISRYFHEYFPNVLSEEKAAEIWRTAGYTPQPDPHHYRPDRVKWVYIQPAN